MLRIFPIHSRLIVFDERPWQCIQRDTSLCPEFIDLTLPHKLSGQDQPALLVDWTILFLRVNQEIAGKTTFGG